MTMGARRVVGGFAVLLGCACGGEPRPPHATPDALPAPVSTPALAPTVTPRVAPEPEPPAMAAFPTPPGEPRYKRVVSKRLRLSVPLPHRSGWVLERQKKSSFLMLVHGATQSQLLIALWREDEKMNRARCEERARWLRDLPTRSGGALSSRFVSVPAGFDTQVDVGFDSAGEGSPIDGWVLAFGGLARECFALVFTTTAAGDDAERIVGDRLAVMQTLTLEGIERRTGTDVDRER